MEQQMKMAEHVRFMRWCAQAGIEGTCPGGIDETHLVRGLGYVRKTCRDAWRSGLMAGFNGNMSLRIAPESMLVTVTGVPKGHMRDADIALASLPDGHLLAGRALSSETAMHVAIYRARPQAVCVLHTHPASLLALSLRLQGKLDRMLDLPLFEAAAWKKRLVLAPACKPGSEELAQSVGTAVQRGDAVFMTGHGLCVVADSPEHVLGISEQLEHLAQIQLLLL